MSIIDLLSILPFLLPFVGVDLRFLRVLRLFRIVRVARIGRYYSSLRMIKNVFSSKKEELVLTTMLMIVLLIISASLMYFCENEAQPEAFSSIPASMWWAVATLTTVGYGDIFPITELGKVVSSIVSVIGIGLFALPVAIIGSGFVEEITSRKKGRPCCPHCGKDTSLAPQAEALR